MTVEFSEEKLRQILSAPRGFGPAQLLSKARLNSSGSRIAALVISILAHENPHLLTRGAKDELDRARDRAEIYSAVWQAVAARSPSAFVIKGPELSSLYPRGIVRPVGDLDVVCPSQDRSDFWSAVIAARRAFDPKRVRLEIFECSDEQTHYVVSLHRPSPDPLLDPELRLEISTFAFINHSKQVPIRRDIPQTGPVRQLISIANEGFTRTWSTCDIFDALLVLKLLTEAEWESAVDAAMNSLVAPELASLIQRVVEVFPEMCESSARFLSMLSAADEAERQRRADADRSPPVADLGAQPLTYPSSQYSGFEIRRTALSARGVVVLELDQETVCETPVGHFLIPGAGTNRDSIRRVRELVDQRP